MTFTLADIESGNFVGGYGSEDEALRDVLGIVERYGPDSREVLSLSLAADDGFVAEGRDLAKRALKRLRGSTRTSAG